MTSLAIQDDPVKPPLPTSTGGTLPSVPQPKPPTPTSTGGTLPSVPQPTTPGGPQPTRTQTGGLMTGSTPPPDRMQERSATGTTAASTGSNTTGTVKMSDGRLRQYTRTVGPDGRATIKWGEYIGDPAKPPVTVGTPPKTDTGTGTGTGTSTGTGNTATQPAAFDPNSFAAQMQSWTKSLVEGLKPQPIEIKMPEAWKPTKENLEGISAASRIPGLLTGATAQQAAQQALAQANSRGLLNSSMAVQGANNAMIANAAEIAAGDATRYGGLLQTQVTNEGALQRLGVQGQINERQSALDQGYKLDSMGVNMMGDAMKFDAQNARDDAVYGRNRADALADRADARGYAQSLYERDRGDFVADRDFNNARTDAQRAEATETALRTAYATEVDSIKDALNREVAAIQQSDLPPDVKDAQVQEVINRAKVNVRLTNTLFQAMPQWKAEWAQLTLD